MSSAEFLFAIINITMIDIVLAGDNAVVIAMAVHSLTVRQRRIGIFLGAGGAVVLRVGLTFVVSQLLGVPYVKLAGGLLVIWIAVKLLKQSSEGGGEQNGRTSNRLWDAVWLILIADLTMSTDNVLAVAAASQGDLALLIFGLGLSIPLVVFTSGLLSRLMERYPIVIFIGAAILGRVGGEMMMGDPLTIELLGHPPHWLSYVVEGLLATVVVLLGLYYRRAKIVSPPAPIGP